MDPREQLASALTGFLTPEQSKTLVDEVLAVTKTGRATFNCRKCGQLQTQYAEIPDARAVASALSELSNQAFGRPTEASVQNVEPIKLIRLTNMNELNEFQATAKPARLKRNTKVRKGEIARQAGSASRKRTSVDKSVE